MEYNWLLLTIMVHINGHNGKKNKPLHIQPLI